MPRRIGIVIALLLAAAWALSYFRIGTQRPMGNLSRFQLLDGAIVFLTRPIAPSRIMYNASGSFLRTVWWSGFDFTDATMSVGSVTTRVMVIPLWMPFVLAIGAAMMLPGKRFPPGTCSHCGYDLRGAKHNACPECGNSVDRRLQLQRKDVLTI